MRRPSVSTVCHNLLTAESSRIAWRSVPLPGSNRIAERPEFARARLPASASEGVERIRQLDIDKTRATDYRLPPCTRQGTCDSTGPQIDVAESVLRHRTLQADIGHRHPTARLQHPEDLPVDTDLVRA